MHDNTSSHSTKATISYLATLGFEGETWPSSDLNPIVPLWTVLKRIFNEEYIQFSSKDVLWLKIKTVFSTMTISRLTSSVDKRLM